MLEMLLHYNPPSGSGPFTPPEVIAGKAFQGWVASGDFITGDALATAIGLAAGTSHNSDAGWLHYIDGAREFYIARKTLRYNLSWSPIEIALGSPNKIIQIGADYYQVKQMTSMSVDPFSSIVSNDGGGDWNKYIYPLVSGPARAQFTAEVWSYYTETDLGLSAVWGTQPNGSITHTVEKHNTIPDIRAARGRTYSGSTAVSSVTGRTVYNAANPSEGNAGTGLSQYGWRPILEKVPEPPPADLYYGEVASADFITASALATAVGASALGTVTNADVSWLKFRIDGKTQYIAKKPLRHGVTWNSLNALGLVFGTQTVVIGGQTYKVRLPTGTSVPSANVYNPAHMGGDFNDMIYPIYGGVVINHAMVQAYPRWAAFTDAELGLNTVKSPIINGGLTLCQELAAQGGYLVRGYNDNDNAGVAQLVAGWYVTGDSTIQYSGWRPVLELVP
jgi:hypothetical protein